MVTILFSTHTKKKKNSTLATIFFVLVGRTLLQTSPQCCSSLALTSLLCFSHLSRPLLGSASLICSLPFFFFLHLPQGFLFFFLSSFSCSSSKYFPTQWLRHLLVVHRPIPHSSGPVPTSKRREELCSCVQALCCVSEAVDM